MIKCILHCWDLQPWLFKSVNWRKGDNLNSSLFWCTVAKFNERNGRIIMLQSYGALLKTHPMSKAHRSHLYRYRCLPVQRFNQHHTRERQGSIQLQFWTLTDIFKVIIHVCGMYSMISETLFSVADFLKISRLLRQMLIPTFQIMHFFIRPLLSIYAHIFQTPHAWLLTQIFCRKIVFSLGVTGVSTPLHFAVLSQ